MQAGPHLKAGIDDIHQALRALVRHHRLAQPATGGDVLQATSRERGGGG